MVSFRHVCFSKMKREKHCKIQERRCVHLLSQQCCLCEDHFPQQSSLVCCKFHLVERPFSSINTARGFLVGVTTAAHAETSDLSANVRSYSCVSSKQKRLDSQERGQRCTFLVQCHVMLMY